MEDNVNEISLIQFFKVAFGNKRRLVVITALIVIIGVLFFKLFYDPGKASYVAEFTYYVKGLNSGVYIDGSAFNYEEMVNYDALKSAKEYDSSFSDIDIESICDKGGISIEKVKEENIKTGEYRFLNYKLTVKSKYFDDGEQAKAFVKCLIEAPIRKTFELSDSSKYKYYLKSFEKSESFGLQLSTLEAQLELLDNKYTELKDYYGDIALYDNETITDKKKSMDVYFMNNSISYLRYELEENGYVLDKGNNIANLKLKRSDLEKQLKYNEMELEKLEKSIASLMGTVSSGLQSAEISSYNSRITELISTDVSITKAMDIIDLQLKNINNADNATYAKKLEDTKLILDGYTDYYQQVEYQVLLSESKAFYQKTSVIEAQGGIGIILGALISGVIGGIVACCFNLVIGWRDVFKNPFEDDKKVRKQVESTEKVKRTTRR